MIISHWQLSHCSTIPYFAVTCCHAGITRTILRCSTDFLNLPLKSIVTKYYEIRITGRVQGVGFRYAAKSKARELGLAGWVENMLDGSVHAGVQGSAEACHEFIRWCGEGTGYSWVEKVETEEKLPGEFRGFHIRR